MSNQRVAPKNTTETGIWVFYALFVGLHFFEGAIVGAILHLASWLHAGAAGPWAAWVAFVAGGIILGNYELHSINTDQKLKDPLLRFCVWLQRRFGPVGFLINAVVIGGSPGAAIALKKVDHPQKSQLTLLAAILFASVWVPLFVYVWR